MIMNNRCGCGYNPCQCHTTCNTPVACIPAPLAHRPSSPTVSVEGLLKLIDAKCDEEICGFMQGEITLLFTLLGLENHRPGTPVVTPVATTPVQAVPALPTNVLQLISNMVETLNRDLTNKYASAELLKKEIKAIWECLYNKQQHHGEWDTNFIVRDLLHPEDDHCLFDGDINSIPNTTKVIVPVDVGSTVFHTINGKRCLYESLIDNNIVEPSETTVASGLWLNYCHLQDANARLIELEELTSLPSGGRTLVSNTTVVEVTYDGNPTEILDINGVIAHMHDFEEVTWTLDPAQYKYLSKAGRHVTITGNASIAYRTEFDDKLATSCHAQWGTDLKVDGVSVKSIRDAFCLDVSGGHDGLSDNFSCHFVTTGQPIAITFCFRIMFSTTAHNGTTVSSLKLGDKVVLDTGTAVISLAGSRVI